MRDRGSTQEPDRMTAAIETRAGETPDGWDGMVAALGAGIFQSSAWAAYQEALTGDEVHYLLARDGAGAPAGAALGFFRRSRRPVLSLLFRDFTLSTHPIARAGSPETSEHLVRASEGLGRALGCATIGLPSFGSGKSGFAPAAHGYRESTRVEFLLDLTAGLEAAWQGMDKKQRERVRQLERKGIEVAWGQDSEALGALQSLRGSTQRKRTEQGQGYELHRDERLDAALLRHLLRPGHARIFLARSGGAPVAGILFATFAGRAYSVFSGSSAEGYRLGAQSLLYWRAVQCFAGEGFVELNRGGVPAAAEDPTHPLHGIYGFKLRLGTTPHVCRSGLKVLSPVRASLAGLRQRLRGGGDRHAPGEE